MSCIFSCRVLVLAKEFLWPANISNLDFGKVMFGYVMLG